MLIRKLTLFLSVFAIASVSYADDEELNMVFPNVPLAAKTQGVDPNILLLVDESLSMTMSGSDDVFYAPGFDANRLYDCGNNYSTIPANGSTITVYVSRSSPSGVPYFAVNGNYYRWGNNPNTSLGGHTIAGAVCFDPNLSYSVKLQANDCSHGSRCVSTRAAETLDGNFLNWYFSNASTAWADQTLTGGYPSTWAVAYATNFSTTTSNNTNNGMKPGVSYSHQRMEVAKDVAKKVVRDTVGANLGLASYTTSGTTTTVRLRLQHDLAPLLPPEKRLAGDKTNNYKLDMIERAHNLSTSGYTPTGNALLAAANFFFHSWGETSIPSLGNTKLKNLFNKSFTGNLRNNASWTKKQHITEAKWCQKNAIALLTDGSATQEASLLDSHQFGSYIPAGLNPAERTTFNNLGNTNGSQTDCPKCDKNLVRIVGALYDHDFLPDMRGKQNIETFIVAFGDQSILNKDSFILAGVAGGGGANNFYAARSGSEVAKAFNDIIARVQASSASVTAVAVNTVSENRVNDSYAVQATYETEYWSSSLKAFRMNNEGLFINPDGTGTPQNTSAGISPVWDANEVLNRMYILADNGDVRQRKVYTWDGTQGVRFGSNTMSRPATADASFDEFDNLPNNIKNDLLQRTGVRSDKREAYDIMMYLLGDITHEENYPLATGQRKYRSRGTYQAANNNIVAVTKGGMLGDIVNSSPIYVKEPPRPWDDRYYGVDGKRYSDFVSQHLDREAMIYVGTNRGFLHGFAMEADVTDPTSLPAGREIFAYMPSVLASTLSKAGFGYLANKSYDHHFYVDLTVTNSDVFVDFYNDANPDPEWRSILVGGLRSGARGIFALDVTCPFQTNNGSTCDDESFGPQNVLWEFSAAVGEDGRIVGDADLGYTFAEPIISKVNYVPLDNSQTRNGNGHGRWAAIVSNGYNSTNGKAALFILFLDGGRDGVWEEGKDYLKIVVGDASDNNQNKNGLSAPVAVDLNNDGIVDRVYAGDLKGQLWVFDLTTAISYRAED